MQYITGADFKKTLWYTDEKCWRCETREERLKNNYNFDAYKLHSKFNSFPTRFVNRKELILIMEEKNSIFSEEEENDVKNSREKTWKNIWFN